MFPTHISAVFNVLPALQFADELLRFAFVHYINTNLDTSPIFSQTGPPRRVDARPSYGSVGVMYLSNGHNNAI